ncbi:hypothetical protein XAPC_4019 [Xanthomonas citri pv. punicae str. LMG 859]|nr:hypothetical protein XAPC_4019 [Xanthomonas citri pv. punicae str. LMG 859]
MDQRECFGIADHVQDSADQWMTRLGYRPLAQQVQAWLMRRRRVSSDRGVHHGAPRLKLLERYADSVRCKVAGRH